MREVGVGTKFLVLAGLILSATADAGDTPVRASAQSHDERADTKAVLTTVDALFAAFETGDAAAMLRQVYPDGRVTASGTRGDGASNLRQQPWTVFAGRIKPTAAFQERISDPEIHIDGDIAMLWAPFVVRIGGKVSNCGFDHFDFVRENGVWKVMNLTFSSRIDGCPEA